MAALNTTVVGEGCSLKDLITKTNPNILLVSPKIKAGTNLMDTIYSEFPSLKNSISLLENAPYGTTRKDVKLRHIIHPEFVTYPGTLKFTDVMCYTPPSLFPFAFTGLNAEAQTLSFQSKGMVIYSLSQIQSIISTFKTKNQIGDSVIIGGNLRNHKSMLPLLACLSTGTYCCVTNTITNKRLSELMESQRSTSIVLDNEDSMDIDVNSLGKIYMTDEKVGKAEVISI